MWTTTQHWQGYRILEIDRTSAQELGTQHGAVAHDIGYILAPLILELVEVADVWQLNVDALVNLPGYKSNYAFNPCTYISRTVA